MYFFFETEPQPSKYVICLQFNDTELQASVKSQNLVVWNPENTKHSINRSNL